MPLLPADVMGLSRSPIIIKTARETQQDKALVMVIALISIHVAEAFDLMTVAMNLDVEPDVVLLVLDRLAVHCREQEMGS